MYLQYACSSLKIYNIICYNKAKVKDTFQSFLYFHGSFSSFFDIFSSSKSENEIIEEN